ncbi:ABC-2 family transporter protein [Lactobacillus sp. R2/2]|nr:ABC-2 family transporter protein [Lactobacillus sp. R2/2]
MNDKVRSGDIALDLLKPVAFATQLLWESIGYSVVKFAVIGTVDLLVCLWILHFQIAVGTILMVLVTTTLAYLLYFELDLLLGTFSFILIVFGASPLLKKQYYWY